MPKNRKGSGSRKVPTNQQIAMAPSTFVITICDKAPTNMPITPKTRFRGVRNITRPPYSPIRFGVNTAHDSPQSTDSTALLKRIGSKRLQMYLHLIVSNNQFPIIKRNTATKENPTACKSAALISILKSFSASLLESKR